MGTLDQNSGHQHRMVEDRLVAFYLSKTFCLAWLPISLLKILSGGILLMFSPRKKTEKLRSLILFEKSS